MAVIMKIKSLEGINWEKNHYVPEIDKSLSNFIESGEIAIGDEVTIENMSECPYPLYEDEYCVTFDKEISENSWFFHEELFTKSECKLLFGEDFNC